MKKIAFVLLLLLIIAASCKRTTVSAEMKDFVKRSDFIFSGTVLLLNTSTIDAEDPKDMVVVRVDKIIRGSVDLSAIAGKQITVRLKNADLVKKDESRIFFTRATYFGESMGVDEIGSYDLKRYPDIDEQVKQANKENDDSMLRARLEKTEMVVSGKVISVKRSQNQPEFISEHNPDWLEAEIEVSSSLKGANPGKIVFLFPGSEDELYMDSPKFKVGDNGIFLLRKGNLKLADEEMFSVVSRQDFLKEEQSARIKSLIGK